MNHFVHKTILSLMMSGMLFTSIQAADQAHKTAESDASTNFTDTLSGYERAWLNEHPVISVAIDPGWPPVEFKNEHGDPSGISQDYLNIVEQKLGVKFRRIQKQSWQEMYAQLKRHEIDMTACVAETPERNTFWSFTKPYIKIPIVIATQMNIPYISGMDELSGRKVAIVESYAIDYWIPKDFPGIRLVRVKTALEGLQLLQSGEVYAYIDNLLIIGDYQAKMQITNIKIAGQTQYVNAQSMAVRKDWAILAGIIQKALDSIPESEQKDIYRKWLPVRYEYGFNYSLLWKVLAGFVVVFIVMAFWNRKLASEIKIRKKAEERSRNLLKEKELLLQEVHHRIKNNMNTVKGLLTLQISAEENPKVAASLRDTESRVQSMIILYDRLYSTEHYRELSVKEYLQSLIDEIVFSFPKSSIVKIETEIEDFILNVNILSPLGIILNEILTNIMKYAFTDRDSGEITLTAALNQNHVRISIQDNGIGFPESIDFRNTKSFGLDLVNMLTEQIGGSIKLERGEGTRFILEFDIYPFNPSTLP